LCSGYYRISCNKEIFTFDTNFICNKICG
jgi:hypothetical protein